MHKLEGLNAYETYFVEKACGLIGNYIHKYDDGDAYINFTHPGTAGRVRWKKNDRSIDNALLTIIMSSSKSNQDIMESYRNLEDRSQGLTVDDMIMFSLRGDESIDTTTGEVLEVGEAASVLKKSLSHCEKFESADYDLSISINHEMSDDPRKSCSMYTLFFSAKIFFRGVE